ncbi:FAD-dependent oxidoreductase [Betaproteobacteria bacterium]|nr:FAD-dependent oxidoreductase [Betaproteobacteria bacterium]
MTRPDDSSDVIVVGAGLVGSALAYGLARQGLRVTMLDEGDIAWRAWRANFGLVWVQGKGQGLVDYARWSLGSARLWPKLHAMLREETGIDVQLRQGGGFHLCLSEQELVERGERLQCLQEQLGQADYPFEILDPQSARAALPGLGPDVPGASFSPMDGHVNPLKLLYALRVAGQRSGVRLFAHASVQRIDHTHGIYTADSGERHWQAPRIVITAGLSTQALAGSLGLSVPVRPVKGEVLITERVTPFLRSPTNYVRQTDEGTVQIGESREEAGFDDRVNTAVCSRIAERALRCFPQLRHARLVRIWAALRIMTPDGFPIYQQSESCPGAYALVCHSGVTLAAQHALTLAPWIAGGDEPEVIAPFSPHRFSSDILAAPHAH